MKWGDKAPNGCKKVPCDKLHPQVCPRSLDLKCTERNCDVKLHIKKCVRREIQSRDRSNGNRQSNRYVRGDTISRSNNYSSQSRLSPFIRNEQRGSCTNPQIVSHHDSRSVQHQPSFTVGGSVQPRSNGEIWNSHFQQRCTAPAQAVHQLLETWAGNMQQEIQRQVKEIHSLLGDQGLNNRPFY